MNEKSIDAAAEILAVSKYVIAFTGAGISAESGIPTFRDPGGVWDRYDPQEIGTVHGLTRFARRHPVRLRDLIRETLGAFEQAQPNPGHQGLAELERMGVLQSVITQNGDDLHSIAGNTRVFEVHGNMYKFRCTACGRSRKHRREEVLPPVHQALDREPFLVEYLLEALPVCECGAVMRPDVVMFGEAVQNLAASFDEARCADAVLVLGTSAMVWPAAGVPYESKRNNGRIIEINPQMHAYREITDVYIQGLGGEVMPRLVNRVKELL